MPLRLLCSAIICLGLSAPARAEYEPESEYDDAQFPYDASVNADDVYVRSGPGQNYYPVLRLKSGDKVEVYRHDPGGWYAIRPPAECYSWVSAEFVEPSEGRMAVIKGERVVARVGSAFSDIRDVIQVRLDEGELVEVLEAKRIGSGPAAQTWYKIAPPAGEFRWVSGQFISHDPPEREVRHRDANNNLLIARHSKREEEPERARESGWHDRRHSAKNADLDAERDAESRREQLAARRSRSDFEDDEPASDRLSRKHAAMRHHEPAARNEDASPASNSAKNRRRATPAGDSQLLQELEELDLDLSTEVAKDPASWNLDPLRRRTDALLTRSDTALDRGRVRLVQRKVARFEDIKYRADAIQTAQLATDLRNQDAQRSSLGGSIGVRNDGRYDGVGKLTQIYPAQAGVASFALVDKEGKVTQYVTAAPGVNLRPYLGREVGIQGTLGFMPDARTSHVTAKRVAVVDDARTIR